MVSLGSFGDLGTLTNGLIGKLFSGAFIVFLLLIMMVIIVGAALYIRHWRQYNIFVEIKSRRSSGTNQIESYKLIYDKGALIYDNKDKIWYFRLYDHKIDLPVPPYEVLQNSTKGNVLKLLQKSQDEFTFLLPDRIDRTKIVRIDGKEYDAAIVVEKQVEGDVAFWNQLRKEKNKQLFDPEGTLMKLLPYIIPVLMFMLVIFISWILIKKFDTVAQVAASMDSAAKAIAAYQGGNTIPA